MVIAVNKIPPEHHKYSMRSQEFITEAAELDTRIIKHLKSKGYKKLGSGADQWAFLEPSTGQVLKIFGTADTSNPTRTFSKAQEMAIFWIKYCQKNNKNPFLPKFSGWSKFVFDDRVYLQIRMERLGNSKVDWESAVSMLGRDLEAGVSLMQILTNIFDSSYISDRDMTLIMTLGEDGVILLWKTLSDIMKIGNSKGWDWDLHDGNVMTRNDGTPVIIDPWYLGEEGSSWWE